MTVDALESALRRKSDGAPIWRFFDERVRRPEQARASLPVRPVAAENCAGAASLALSQAPSAPGFAVYLHIPFCASTCDFCPYCRSVVDDEAQVRRYLDVLSEQILEAGSSLWGCSAPVSAVYVGGGTPTSVPIDALAEVVRLVLASFQCTEDCEVTVESRPADIDPSTVEALCAAGVNRVSVGVQTFDSEARRRRGRKLGDTQVREALRRLGASKLTSVAADLMYGLPDQTPESFERDLDGLSGGLTGASVYPLVLVPRTGLFEAVSRGEAGAVGSIAGEHAFHTVLEDKVEGRGWRFITPVQLGFGVRETAAYVCARARNWDVLGLGAGSVGSIGTMSYRLNPDLRSYIAAGGRDLPVVSGMQLDARVARLMAIFSLTETADGIKAKDWIDSVLASVLGRMMDLGVVRMDGESLTLTRVGRFWAGNLSAILCDSIGASLGSGPD
jgi:coproporphyrinogen III oxidase-like Fe-S oxidoreductase